MIYIQKKSFSKTTSNGRRISCKKRESRKVFELRRQLNSRVGRRCAPDDRRRFRRPLYGRSASVQHSLNLHCLNGNVRLKRVLDEIYDKDRNCCWGKFGFCCIICCKARPQLMPLPFSKSL